MCIRQIKGWYTKYRVSPNNKKTLTKLIWSEKHIHKSNFKKGETPVINMWMSGLSTFNIIKKSPKKKIQSYFLHMTFEKCLKWLIISCVGKKLGKQALVH